MMNINRIKVVFIHFMNILLKLLFDLLELDARKKPKAVYRVISKGKPIVGLCRPKVTRY